MNNKATLAIYGIKDRANFEYPSYTHDHNICLMQNGKIIQYLQLERYSRRKYDNRLDLFLEDLIEKGLLELPEEFDLVSVNSFLGNGFITKSGKIRFDSLPGKQLGVCLENAYGYYQYSDWEGKEINAYNCSQELAHIFSCIPFFGNFKENSLLIHFDGASSLSNFSAFHFKDNKIQLIEYHWDLKHIANFFNDNALTFSILGLKLGEHTSAPGKLMGYASLGKYNMEIENWLTDNNYFKEFWGKENEILKSINQHFKLNLVAFDSAEKFFQDVAATFQTIFENVLLQKMKELQEFSKTDYLYYSGGCALNIVTNTKLIEKSLFKDIFIPPCCNDSGLSIGGAAFLEFQKGNSIAIHSPYLNNIGLQSNQNEVSDETIIQVSKILIKGGIIGICNDFSEAGPRALGNRSLISLANSKNIAQKVSVQIKKREWYRPVAPIMLKEIAEVVTEQKINHLSKFMLLDYTIKNQYYTDLEGVIHVNGTSRIQTITSKKENEFMYKLLHYLYSNHNILALINTSFNIQGEPIVHFFESALQVAKEMKIDGIVINNQFQSI
jgi:carbamoyltransferase